MYGDYDMEKSTKIKATINFHYHNENQAEIAFKSLKPDNIGFLESYSDHNSFVCNLKGESLKTILSTADDLIFSEMLVEKVLELQDK
jgi:quinol monooxygenase YgiN